MTDKPKKSKKPSATKAESLLDESVFFIDRWLGKQVGLDLRTLGYKVELHDDHFDQATDDATWLTVVGEKGWLVLTKDGQIRKRPTELNAVLTAKVMMFALSDGNVTGEEMSRIFSDNLTRIGRFLKNNPPPFIARVSQTRVEALDLSMTPRKADPKKEEGS